MSSSSRSEQRGEFPTSSFAARFSGVAPTRWLLLGLGIILGMRAVAWFNRRIWLPALPPARDLAKGILWDIALTIGVFLLARVALGFLPPSRSPWRRRLAFAPFALLAVTAMFIRWLDAGHCLMVRAHWTQEAFLYLDEGFAGSLADPRLLAALAGWLLTSALLALALWRDAAVARPAGPMRGLVVAAVLAMIPAAWAIRDGVKYPPYAQQARIVPEVNFAVQWRAYSATPKSRPLPQLSADQWQRFVRLGLVAPDLAREAEWPALHQHLDTTPFPYPRIAAATATPNVVLTLMESTNTLFIHGLSGHYRGLMPEVSTLAEQMTSVDGFVNTTSPTIAALVTALCSVHPAVHPSDLRPGKSVGGRAAYTCLADILRDRGYRTVFVQASGKTVTGKEYFLRTHGFDEVYGRDELAPHFANRPQGPWGLHDDELVEFTKEQIRRLEQQQREDGRPFLLVMLTLDTHAPGMAGPDCRLPANVEDVPDSGAARQLLASYHCADRAMGRLGRFLLDGARGDRTLWLLTADHAAFPDTVPEIYDVDPSQRLASTNVPFLLHDPLHRLPAKVPTLSGTRDIAPTLLHVLGITKVANSMGGESIFGKRRKHPLLIGRVGSRLVLARTPEASIELPVGEVREDCARGDVLLHTQNGDFTACDAVAWLDWRDALWGAHRLFPGYLYRGADGIDRDELQRRQDPNEAESSASEVSLPGSATRARAPAEASQPHGSARTSG